MEINIAVMVLGITFIATSVKYVRNNRSRFWKLLIIGVIIDLAGVITYALKIPM
jgi:hypothetical protein